MLKFTISMFETQRRREVIERTLVAGFALALGTLTSISPDTLPQPPTNLLAFYKEVHTALDRGDYVIAEDLLRQRVQIVSGLLDRGYFAQASLVLRTPVNQQVERRISEIPGLSGQWIVSEYSSGECTRRADAGESYTFRSSEPHKEANLFSWQNPPDQFPEKCSGLAFLFNTPRLAYLQ